MIHDRPLRIIHCFRSPVGGIFRHVRDLAEQHHRAGHQVGILCDSSTGGSHEHALFEAIRPFLALGLTRIPIRRAIGPGDLAAMRAAYQTIKSLQPDILHGHGAKGGALARVIGSVLRVKRYRVARFYSPHGGSLHFDAKTAAGRAVFLMERMLERLTDGLVFVCAYEQGVYEAKVGQPRVAARMIYNGIADRDFLPVPTVTEGVHFLYAGMLRDLKGPDIFIDAFARAERAVGHPLSAMIVGDGPDRERYQTMITESGLGRRIGLLPAMPVRDAFSMSNLVVIPSRAEAMPYIVIEALAAGKGVIATRVGGIPEVLGPGSDALVPPGDPTALGAAMALAVTTPDWQRRTMPTAEALRARFSAAVMADEMMHFYRERLAAA